MKVLIVTTAFPRWLGDGRGNFVFEAAKAIKGQGWDVRVIAMHTPGASTHEWMDGIEVIRPRYLPEQWEILARESAGLPQAWRTNPWTRLAIIPFLVTHALAVMRYAADADIIHANWTLSGMIAWLTYWWHRKPFVVTVHGSDVFQATKSKLIREITRIVLSSPKTRSIIAVSNALANHMKKMNLPGEKIYVIPDGVDVSFFHPPESDFRENEILYVGSLTYLKGVDILIRAFANLEAKWDYRLVIAGEGTYWHELETLVHTLGLERKVEFLGPLSREEVAKRMRRAKIFVLPSRSEGLGVVLLEALASGTPCVASREGGIPEVITPDVGLLFKPGDVDGLVRAICQLLEQDLKKIGENARRKALEHYDWNKVAMKILHVYRASHFR